jgi:hypothetical protein
MIKRILGVSIAVAIIIIVLIEPTFEVLNQGYFFNQEENLLEPAFWFNGFIIVSAIVILMFKQIIQTLWWRWAKWVMLVSLPVILSGSTSGYAWLRRTDLAILCGLLLLSSTVVFALTARFYFKIK